MVGSFGEEDARVVELADTPDLGSGAVRCEGSSPSPSTSPKVVHASSVMRFRLGSGLHQRLGTGRIF